MRTEVPTKPIYGETLACVYLTNKQAEVLREIAIQEIVDEENAKLSYWRDTKWINVNPEQTAMIIAKLTELAKTKPEYKNMATRVSKLLTNEIQAQWERRNNQYNKAMENLRTTATMGTPEYRRELTTSQYGYELRAKTDEFDWGIRFTIAPVTFLENGTPVVKWTADTHGMYLSRTNSRTEKELFDTVEEAITKAHTLVDVDVAERIAKWETVIAEAQQSLAELENA